MTLPIHNFLKPFQDPFKAHLKEVREAESLQNAPLPIGVNPFDEPIFCTPDPIQRSAKDGDWKHAIPLDGHILDEVEGVSLQENFEWLRQEFDHLVTIDDIADEVFDADDDSNAANYTWEQVTNKNAEFGPAFDLNNLPVDHRPTKIGIAIRDFIKETDPHLIQHLVQCHDPDESLRFLADPFLNYCGKDNGSLFRSGHFDDALTKDRAFFAALELLVLGIQHTHSEVAPDEGKCGFADWHIRLVRSAVLEQAEIVDEIRKDSMLERVRQIYLERRLSFASPTRDQEDDSNLPPAQKARVFMNALRERNDAGALCDSKYYDHNRKLICVGINYPSILVFRRTDKDTAERFFTDFENVSVRDLLSIVDACVRVKVEAITGRDHDKHTAWHGERGVVIAFLFKHLGKITEELKTRYSFDYTKLVRH
jgi:hypothetical protein